LVSTGHNQKEKQVVDNGHHFNPTLKNKR